MGHFLVALLGKLAADEIKAWLPWITEQLIQAAVRKLPAERQERYNEEWRSHLNDLPSGLAKLWAACGFLYAVGKVSRRRRIDVDQVEFLVALILFLPVFVGLSILSAWNSRRCYTVPILLEINGCNLHITLDRIPLGLALRCALCPRVSLETLNRCPYHYSLWHSSRIVEFEEFISTRVGRYPSLSFGMKRIGPFLQCRNVAIGEAVVRDARRY